MESELKTVYNRRLAQWQMSDSYQTWLIEHSTAHQLLWCIESFVLRWLKVSQSPKSATARIANIQASAKYFWELKRLNKI